MPNGKLEDPEMKMTVRYRGGTAEGGRMGAGELGSAILGLGELMKGVASAVHQDEMRVKTEVDADFESSSFAIDFVVVAVHGELVDPLTVEQIKHLIHLLFGGSIGLIPLYRMLRGRKIDKIEPGKDGAVITAGDDTYNIAAEQVTIMKNPKVSKGLKSVISPLGKDGAKKVEFYDDDGREMDHIDRDEKKFFIQPTLPDDVVSERLSDATIEVISPSFREGNKWRFAEGGNAYWATVEDEGFLERVNSGDELFGKGHLLHVKLLTVTTRKGVEVEVTRTIKAVLSHDPPDTINQRRLFPPKASEEDE